MHGCRHQSHSFVDDSVLDTTHLWIMFLESAGSGTGITKLVYYQIGADGTTLFTYDQDTTIAIFTNLAFKTAFIPSRNELIAPVYVGQESGFVPGTYMIGIYRTVLTSPPSVTLERIAPWVPALSEYDTTFWVKQGAYAFSCLTDDGRVAVFVTVQNYNEGGDVGNSLFYSINTPLEDGTTIKGWSHWEELYSTVWNQYPGAQDFGGFNIEQVFSAEPVTGGGFYIHFSGYPEEGGEANYTLTLPGPAAPSLLPFRWIFSVPG
jgi:hypothetical protein